MSAALRELMLTSEPSGDPPALIDGVSRVVVDISVPPGVATVAVAVDGTVSIYFSGGGGVIGLGEHEGPRRAGLELIAQAGRLLGLLTFTSAFPLPDDEHARFYVVTTDGVFTGEAGLDALVAGREPLSPLFAKANDVITQWRLHTEARQMTTPSDGLLDVGRTE